MTDQPLPISSYRLVHGPDTPNTGGRDGYRWKVALEENGAAIDYLLVDLSRTAAIETGLSDQQLDEQLPAVLQRFARSRLDNYRDALEQVATWDSPIVLRAQHFLG